MISALKSIKRKWGSFLLLTVLSTALTSSTATGPTNKTEKPPRPRISQAYESLLLVSSPELQREAQKQEWDWHGYADKMEMRAGYK